LIAGRSLGIAMKENCEPGLLCVRCRAGQHTQCTIFKKPNHGMEQICKCVQCRNKIKEELKTLRESKCKVNTERLLVLGEQEYW
jgi:hypothetical protein